jgi:NADPH:quinone reductase-like Zn-dependent oxidoreductase
VYSRFPYKIGYDLSGTVVAVGSDVAHTNPDLVPGTEVYTRLPETSRGSVSEYAISTASTTAKKPKSISHSEAASIPLVSLTTLQTFDLAASHFEDRDGLVGKTILIPGGLSGTGSIAIQLAKRVFNAGRVITTLSTPKIAQIGTYLDKSLLNEIVDYTKEDPLKVIPHGSVDFMYDTMGHGVSYLPLMKKGGIIVTISGLPFGPKLKTGMPEMPSAMRWILNSIGGINQFRAQRYGVTYLHLFIEPSAADLTRLATWTEEGKIKPVVGAKAAFDDLEKIREKCQRIYSKKGGIGKFVIDIA